MKGKIPWDIQRPGAYTISEWEIDPVHSSLLILDMQRGYVDPNCGLGIVLKKKHPDIYQYYYGRLAGVVLPNILKLRDLFRRYHLEIFYTCMGLQLPDGKDLAPWNWRSALIRSQNEGERCLYFRESMEYKLVEALEPLKEELVLDKNSLNPFNSTPLDQILRNMNIENLIITGILTNLAVESTARAGGDRGYNVIVIEDASAAYRQAEHNAALRSPPSSSFVVKTTKDIIRDFIRLF